MGHTISAQTSLPPPSLRKPSSSSCHISKASVEEFGFGLDDIGVFRDAEGNVAVVKDSIHQGTGTPGRTARDRKSKHYHPTVAATNFVS